MPYSAVGDLFLGDTILGSGVDPQAFVDGAADEIDSKIGWLYVTPVDLDGDALAMPPIPVLPRHEALLLKGINNKLASGRLILTLDIAGEGTTLHAYGARLVKEAMDELLLIANGALDLSAPRVAIPDADAVNRSPGVVNLDEESLLIPFYQTINRNPWYARPGEARSDG